MRRGARSFAPRGMSFAFVLLTIGEGSEKSVYTCDDADVVGRCMSVIHWSESLEDVLSCLRLDPIPRRLKVDENLSSRCLDCEDNVSGCCGRAGMFVFVLFISALCSDTRCAHRGTLAGMVSACSQLCGRFGSTMLFLDRGMRDSSGWSAGALDAGIGGAFSVGDNGGRRENMGLELRSSCLAI